MTTMTTRISMMMAIALGVLAGWTGEVRAQSLPVSTAAGAAHVDRMDYDRYCSWCHGEVGNGNGPSAHSLSPLPRDFTTGAFRCRQTPSGSLPTDEDLARVIRSGVAGSAMPSWPTLSDRQLANVIATVKSFSPRWVNEKPGARIVVPPEPPATAVSVQRGADIYGRLQCASCHGAAGKGDGPASAALHDDWGNSIRAADFTAPGMMKCGDDAQRIYITFMTGLNGTPMPSYDGTLKPEEAWDLVHFIQSLRH
jgi:cytochrome c oxidase cbb3-type subunit 2